MCVGKTNTKGKMGCVGEDLFEQYELLTNAKAILSVRGNESYYILQLIYMQKYSGNEKRMGRIRVYVHECVLMIFILGSNSQDDEAHNVAENEVIVLEV